MIYPKWSRFLLCLVLTVGGTNLFFVPLSWRQVTVAAPGAVDGNIREQAVQIAEAGVQQQTVESESSQVKYGSFVNGEGLPVDQQFLGLQNQDKGNRLVRTGDQSQTGNNNTFTQLGDGAMIGEIQVRFVDENGQLTTGRTQPSIITREFELQPGDVYRTALAQEGLQRVRELEIVREAQLSLEPTRVSNQVVMVVYVEERSPFSISVVPGSSRAKGVFGVLRLRDRNVGGNAQTLALELEGGERTVGANLSFTDPWIAGDPNHTGYTLNVFTQRSPTDVFIGGDHDIDLPNGNTPWVHRLGGGGEVFRPISSDWTAGVGLSYQRVSIRDQAFTNEVEPVDELGNPLSFDHQGQDDLLTLNLSAIQDRRNDQDYPTQGSKLELGVDQSIPVGQGNILFNRLSGSYTQYIPVEFFGFSRGYQTFVFNLQGGTVIGELPPYEAFSLGGGSSVRGYQSGDVGSGRSFVQATAEYRFPVFSWLGGTLFADYATDLGSGDTVPGEPAEVRDKPGSGFGYGVGVRVRSPFGSVQVDFGFSDQGNSQLHFRVGERF
ncbi:MAG TPA: hypothetical protein DEG47_27490 [Cyanobacteria bacterium UBA11148]|nr:hypothetical protein [Cyanobacteria bacterium UBA11148]